MILVSGPVRSGARRTGVDVIHVRTAVGDARGGDGSSGAGHHGHQGCGRGRLSRRANPPQQKVKKTAARISLELDPTPDILAEVGRKKGDRLLIGFAAETENLIEEARRKLQSKNCDMVVANLVSQEGIGFESDENEVTLVLRTGETIPVERASKRDDRATGSSTR